MVCSKHPTQKLTHFCSLENCLTPLCGRCIKEHNEFHKSQGNFIEVETMDDVKELILNKLDSFYQVYVNDHQSIQQLTARIVNDQMMTSEDKLNKVRRLRQRMTEIIYAYFDNIELQLENQQPVVEKVEQLKIYEQEILNKVMSFESMIKSVEGSPHEFITQIPYYLKADFQGEYQTIKGQIEEIFKMIDSYYHVDVAINEKALPEFE